MKKLLLVVALIFPFYAHAGAVKQTLIMHEEAVAEHIATTYEDFWMGSLTASQYTAATFGNDIAITSQVQFIDKINDRIYLRSCTTQFKKQNHFVVVKKTTCESPYLL